MRGGFISVSQNYGDVIKNTGKDHIVRVKIDGFEPFSRVDEHKTKEKGIFRKRKLDQNESYYGARGIVFSCPVSEIPGNKRDDSETQRLRRGLEGCHLVRMVSVPDKHLQTEWTDFSDCLLAPDGMLICESKPYYVLNTPKAIKNAFFYDKNGRFCEHGNWKFNNPQEIYSQTARSIADMAYWWARFESKSNFKAAESIPASMFKADPKFGQKILQALQEELEVQIKSDYVQDESFTVELGLKASEELKRIIKEKMDEAEKLPEMSVREVNMQELFPGGTFSLDEVVHVTPDGEVKPVVLEDETKVESAIKKDENVVAEECKPSKTETEGRTIK